MRFTEIMPVATLLAALFALGNLARHREITAAMAGGIHPWACAKPLLWCGVFLSLFSLGLTEWALPPTYRRAQALYKVDIRHFAFTRQTEFNNVTAAGRDNVFYLIGSLDTGSNIMKDVVIEFQARRRLHHQIQAEEAAWSNGRWLFTDGVERVFNVNGLGIRNQTSFQTQEILLKESPQDLVPPEPDPEEMGFKAYKQVIKLRERLGLPSRRQRVELALKLAFPWANFIVLFLGIPFAFQKSGGKVRAVGYAIAVVFIYFGLMQVGRALGQKSWCHPTFAAWLPNLIFLSLGSWLFWRMKKFS